MTEPSTFDLLWGLRTPSNMGPAAAFTVTDIAATAVALADVHGFEGVSMEEVARSLGYTKMSLYRHVASKSELLSLMIDLAVGEPPDLSRGAGGWRGRVCQWGEQLWQVWDDHQWLPDVTVGSRPLGPNEVGWSVELLDVLIELGLPPQKTAAVITVISGYLHAAYDADSGGSQPWTPDLQTPTELQRVMSRTSTVHPSLEKLTTDRRSRPSNRMPGLEVILDGIEVHIRNDNL